MLNIVLFVLLVFFAMFVQSLTGFGGPLLAMPMAIILIGVDMARPVITVAAIIAGFMVAAPRWRDINWGKLILMTGVMLVGVIAGDLIFGAVSITPLLVFYGVVVLIIGGKRLFFPKAPVLPKIGQYCALAAAGIMQGLFISGGSFLVLYAVEQMKDKREFRATVSAVWVPLNVYLIAKYIITGIFTAPVLKLSALVIIPELIAIWLAGKLAEKLSQETFLKITYGILTASGICLIVNSVM